MLDTKIIIEDYSPTWALTFEELKSAYLTRLGNLIVDVQHVGSTAVYGLAAKPIIDIDLILHEESAFDDLIEKLALLGYEHMGTQGISDRAAFQRRSDKVPYDESRHAWPAHNLYVCPSGSISLKNHIVLRDFLRSNPEKAKEYGALKKKLALENPYDINLYVARKTPFITAILKLTGFDDDAINNIIRENMAN